ncbi:MAG: hormogonium polysaccharide biosynthesis glycosyltransferase HpsP [Cyanobacteria bacterium P01_D01_bin.1]
MKVLQIVPSLSLVYGGPSQMVRGLSAALARQEAIAQTTVITTDANGDIDEDPLDVPLGQPIAQDGYEVIYFRCAPFRRYKFSTALLRWLWDNAHHYDIAHIHALFSPVSTAAATLCRWQKLPYIMRPLGTLDPADLNKKKHFKKLYAHLLEKPNLAGAAALHFTSEPEAKVSKRFGTKTPAMVLPLGVALPTLPPRTEAKAQIREQFDIPKGFPIILFMSRIDPKKGFDLLLPALDKLHQNKHVFHLLLCGSNPQDREYEISIKQQIESSNWSAQVTFSGFVSGELKAAILSAADLFVLPSYYENFGIAVAEAMAARLPVVISNKIDIWPKVAEYDAGWVVPTEIAPLTQALVGALSDAEVREQKGQNAQRCAEENYGWDAIAHTLTIHYQAIVERNSRMHPSLKMSLNQER